jgi:hypothetical protein
MFAVLSMRGVTRPCEVDNALERQRECRAVGFVATNKIIGVFCKFQCACSRAMT